MLHRVTHIIPVIRCVQTVLTYVIPVITYVALSNISYSSHFVCSDVFNIRYSCHNVCLKLSNVRYACHKVVALSKKNYSSYKVCWHMLCLSKGMLTITIP